MQPDPLKQRALELLKQGALKEARQLYEDLLQNNAMDAELHFMLGAINGRLGNYIDAVTNYQEAIKLQPTAFVAYCGLGAAQKELGNLDEAEQAFHKALRIKSDSPDVLLELAGILYNQTKLKEAGECFHRLLALDPDSSKALQGIGEICQSQGELDEAISWYQRALRVGSDKAVTYNQLGAALYLKGKPEQAISQYQQALIIRPEFLLALKNLGLALMAVGKLDEANNAFQKALQIKPGYVDAIIGEATVLQHQGDYQAAYDRLSPLIESGLKHAGLGHTYAEICRHLNNCQDAADYMEWLLKNEQLTPIARRNSHYTLGALYDRLHSYERAFRNYNMANALHPDTFDPNEHNILIEEFIRTFTWNFMVTAPRATQHTQLPIFIVGMPRSGTSLVEQILSSHPDVFGAGELTDIGNLAGTLQTRLNSKTTYPTCLSSLSREALDSLSDPYLKQLRELSPAALRVTDKMPQNFLHLGLIALLFPKARIIHCTRDPRDTCLSIFFQNFSASHSYAADLQHLGTYYHQYQRLMDHWKTILDLPLLEIRYENMVKNQEAVSRELVAFAGLEWDERCLRFHETGRYTTTASYDQVRQPIYSHSIGRWRNYERHLEPLLDALGDIQK